MTAPEEATAVARAFARALRDMFAALVAEGFTEQQALSIVGQAVTALFIANRSES